MPKISILFYAINGTGLGHLSRLNNIAYDAAYICKEVGINPDFEFITTSDSPSLIKDFLVTKFPSKTTIKELGLPLRKTSAKIKAQIINHVNGFNPDCLVLDTNPKGSYSEFSILRDFARSSVFIDRARKQESINNITKRHIKLFDNVIVPESADQPSSLVFHHNINHCGKIHGFKPELTCSRDEVRNTFGITSGNLVYVSSGGGGDSQSESKLKELIDSVLKADKNAKIVVGYGSLYKGEVCYSNPRLTPYTSNGINKYFGGFDYAVSAAGYNSFEELKAAKCPTLFYPLNKGMDDQEERIVKESKRGLCGFASMKITPSIINEFRLKINNINKKLNQNKFEHGSSYAAESLILTALNKRSISISPDQITKARDKLVSLRNQFLINKKPETA